MLKIRLARGGAKKRPYYSIVVADSHSPRDGRFIEKVGTYNPLLPKDGPTPRVQLKLESIQAWIAKGAQPTDRVARFLAAEGVGQWAHGNNPNKGAPGKKAQERATERSKKEEERAAAAAELAANPPPPPEPEPAPEPEVVAEAPVESTSEVDAVPEAAAEEAPAAEAAPVEPTSEVEATPDAAEAPSVEAAADADPQADGVAAGSEEPVEG